MNEIINDALNAPKEDVFNFISDLTLCWCIGSIAGIALSVILYRYSKKKMGFGPEWDRKWKEFDERFDTRTNSKWKL